MSYSFTLNGTRAESLGIITNKVRRNVLPSIFNRTVEVPGMDGVYYYRSQFKERQIEVDITVTDTSMSNLVDRFNQISYFLSPARGIMSLTFDDDSSKNYKVVVSGETDIDQVRAIGKTTIIFLIPKPFSESILQVTQDLTLIPEVNFARNSNAYRSNGNYVTANVGRGEYLNQYNSVYGVMIEEGTNNHLVNKDSDFENDDSGVNVIGATTKLAKTYYSHTGNYSLEVKTKGVASGEGVINNTKYPVAQTNYTFSAYCSSKGYASIKLFIQEYDSTDGIVTTTYSNAFTLSSTITRYSISVQRSASTAKMSVGIVTSSKQFALFYTDSWQLEPKNYATSWTNTSSRANELAQISLTDTYNIINGYSGTIDLYYKKVTTPSEFAPIFDYGQFSSGNTISRIVLFHNTSIGENKLRLQIVNGSIADSQSATLTLPSNIAKDSLNYIAVRWFLTGDSSGYIKIDHVDMSTMTHNSITTPITLVAPTTFNTNVITLGADYTGSFFINGILGDFRISNYVRSDSEIANSYLSIRPLLKDTQSSVKYSLNVTFRGTNISNIGTAPSYPVFNCYVNQGGISSLTLTVYPENKSITINDSFSIGDIVVIDCYRRLVTKNGSNINSLVTLLSQFPNLTGDHQIVCPNANVTVTYTPNWL